MEIQDQTTHLISHADGDNDHGYGGLTSKTLSKSRFHHARFYICIFLLQFSTNFCYALLDVPLVRLFESAVCRRYYDALRPPGVLRPYFTDVDESECKLHEIQNQLARILGLRITFDAVPGLVMSLWYGWLGNQIGRRPVLVLSTLGESLALAWNLFICLSDLAIPVEVAWLSSMFIFIGGGQRLLLAMYNAMIIDVCDVRRRSRVLFLFYSMVHLSLLTAPPLAAALLKRYIFAPFLLVGCIILLRFFLIWIIPESRGWRHTRATAVTPERPSSNCSSTTSALSATSPDRAAPIRSQEVTSMRKIYFTDAFSSIRSRVEAMLSRRTLRIVLICFTIKRVAFSSEAFVSQYASETLHRRLYETVWLQVSQTSGATIVTSALLPLLLKLLKKRGLGGPVWDLALVRGSLCVLVVGFWAFWSSGHFTTMLMSMFLCGLGEGLEPALQAVAASIVAESYYADLFSLIGTLDTLAKLFAGPIMAWAFSIQTAVGSSGGYCFLFSSILFLSLFLGSWSISTSSISTVYE